MSIFNPEGIFRSLIGALGVTPEQAQSAINLLVTELSTLKSEREAFKSGAGRMVAHYNDRLDNIERKLDMLISAFNLTVIERNEPYDGHNGKHQGSIGAS